MSSSNFEIEDMKTDMFYYLGFVRRWNFGQTILKSYPFQEIQ